MTFLPEALAPVSLRARISPALLLSALTVLLAPALGALATRYPLIAIGIAAIVLAISLLTLGRYLPTVFVAALGGGLLGYMFLGKGFAYAGKPPVFVSELLLALAVLALMYNLPRARLGATHVLLLAFMGWGLLRTAPYLQRDGTDALRDAVVWGYGLFAVALSFMASPRLFEKVTDWFGRTAPVFLVWVPVAGLISLALSPHVPIWPTSNTPIMVFKQGDMAVHLAGVLAFILVGLYGARGPRAKIPGIVLWVLALVAFAFVSMSRGALLTAGIGIAAAALLWPSRRLLPFLSALVLVGTVILILNPRVQFGDSQRNIGVDQVRSSLVSIVSGGGGGNLQGTKEWRLAWWTKIYDYTFKGPFFWTGKGFGLNLADADGFQVEADHSLRAPHSAHVDILARMGVPGIALWTVLQASFGLGLLLAFLRARRSGATFWAQVDAWLLIYWLAMMIDMSFDVYLEGPQGGIWFWTVFGFGLAALAAQEPLLAQETGRLATSLGPAQRTREQTPSTVPNPP